MDSSGLRCGLVAKGIHYIIVIISNFKVETIIHISFIKLVMIGKILGLELFLVSLSFHLDLIA